MYRSEHGFSGLLRTISKSLCPYGLFIILIGHGSRPSEAQQTLAETDKCWPSGRLTFPVGTRGDVLKQSADFLVKVESIPIHPYWPGGVSGISIGVGWDLGQHSASELREDWSRLDAASLTRLRVAANKNRRIAEALLPELKSIVIPRDISACVLEESLRDVHYPMTMRLFPGAQLLPAEFQVALLSVVFNRGVFLGHDPDWRTAKALDTRWEMRKLLGDVASGDLFAIYIRLGTMKRVWENDPKHRGLPIRRKDEQHLIRPYVDKELQWEQKRDDLKAAGLPACTAK